MRERVHLFGIRHHGPGSAASLLAALEGLEPAAVLIELPADAAPALEFAASAGMRPPIALLVHDAKEATRSTFLPFAEFSPEWQALRYALGRAIPVEAIDLPAGVRFREAAEEEDARSEEEPKDDDPDIRVRTDPLDRLAHAAGHSDGEAWWDAIVERAPAGPGVFGAIGDAMAAARGAHETEHPPEPHDLRREAHMRRAIQRALKAYEGPIAVVVGAWHVPALRSKAKGDRERLVGLKPRKAVATWVPWTEPRLAARVPSAMAGSSMSAQVPESTSVHALPW